MSARENLITHLPLRWDNDVVSEGVVGVVGVDNIKHDLVSEFAHS